MRFAHVFRLLEILLVMILTMYYMPGKRLSNIYKKKVIVGVAPSLEPEWGSGDVTCRTIKSSHNVNDVLYRFSIK